MKFRFLALMVATLAFAAIPTVAHAEAHATLKSFRSDDELRQFLQRIRDARHEAQLAKSKGVQRPEIIANVGSRSQAAPPPLAGITGNANVAAGSVSNNQVAGIDEGDIVKASGDLLIVLRRGRLFTLSLAGGGLKPVDRIAASAPGADTCGDWYDEMLISGDRIIVIGYSYVRGGTQVNRFHLLPDGHLAFEDAYTFKANDDYSARKYASRLIGTTLISYSTRRLPFYLTTSDILPALNRLDGHDAVEPIGTARDVYMPPGQDPGSLDTVYTVTRCDLAAPVLACKATSVLGQSGNVFHVASNAIYVWVTAWHGQDHRPPSSMLYRLPLNGGAPAAVGVHGAPVDQFSFNETPRGLDVLVRAGNRGDAMWASEHSDGAIALLHIPPEQFGDGSTTMAASAYRALPQPKGDYSAFHNRFVGDYLLYGTGNGRGSPKAGEGAITVVPVASTDIHVLILPHGVDRIEAMGRDAVVVGSDGKNVVFSAVSFAGMPSLGERYVLAGASQGETRSHGFFFHPETGDDGVLGLPVMRAADPAYRQLFSESASVVFVRRAAGAFTLLGDLPSHPDTARDDACKASCIDWYGNSRPVFYAGRTFALMGYEMVEAVPGARDLRETQRVNFSPATPASSR